MMKNILSPIIYLSIVGICYSQQSEETMIRVYGKVLSEKDSSTVSASLLYEKLPYYDDMGMASSSADGSFELYLADQTSYNIRIDEKEGFQPFAKEFSIDDEDNDGEMNLDLYIEPIEEEELIRLDNLNFARGKAVITRDSYAALDEFIEYINTRKDVNIQLEGHTDIAGDPEANFALSQARVEAVAEYLTKNGVKKSRVSTKAFGETQPLTTERTDEAKAMNRRVEVRLIKINR